MAKLPQWGKYGLAEEVPSSQPKKGYGTGEAILDNELFAEDESASSQKPWWKSNFFLLEPALFGTWDGVFTSCMINVFGVIVFLRMGYIVGNVGLGLSMVVILLTVLVALIAASSGIGICERCQVESGGVYFLLSHVMGARVAGAVGILYCFGQAVACALFAAGFGESMATLLATDNVWVARAIAMAVVILLTVINMIGVTWVIKLQLLLVLIMIVAELDFVIGSFITSDPAHGVTGYSKATFTNNSSPDLETTGETFFTIFGIFFPTMTGIFAGINMSGDLRQPSKDIPVGTLTALAVCTFIYILNSVILGATCDHTSLQTDFMVAEKVSALGVLWLAGLYISSMSSCLGAIYGAPRILQSIANENVIPLLKVLGKGRGPNRVPVYAMMVITIITLSFIMMGKINTLAPIVTMPFMITYAAVDYAYFSMAMTCDIQIRRDERYGVVPPTQRDDVKYGAVSQEGEEPDAHPTPGKSTPSTECPTPMGDVAGDTFTHDDDAKLISHGESNFVAGGVNSASKHISSKSVHWYSFLCNRWLSLGGVVLSLLIIFLVHWGYALANLGVLLFLYAYIGYTNPGVSPGVAKFQFLPWLKYLVGRCQGKEPPEEQIIVTPMPPGMATMAAQLTEDNADFAGRNRYHQSAVVSTNEEY